MIRTLANHGGVMGVNFGPEFLTDDPKCKDNRIDSIAAQLRHMINIGGTGCAAIGTDFDGIHGNMEIGAADRMPTLFSGLQKHGFSYTEIEAIAQKNVLRVLRDTIK